MSEVARRLAAVRARIDAATAAAGRPPGSVELVAVSKTFPPESVVRAFSGGQLTFGENRVQEASAKIPAVAAALCSAPSRPVWHMIGHVQSNKARRAVELFDVIETVDSAKLAAALSRAAESCGRTMRVLLQVNVDEETQKSGVTPREAGTLLARVAALPNLVIAGLMAIPAQTEAPEAARPAFARLRALRDELRMHPAAQSPSVELATLSMGMSGDFEHAIAEGSTCVRIGTAIFGARTPGEER